MHFQGKWMSVALFCGVFLGGLLIPALLDMGGRAHGSHDSPYSEQQHVSAENPPARSVLMTFLRRLTDSPEYIGVNARNAH